MIELVFLGAFVGMIAGFFGVGGGGILIPILLFFGYQTKEAIGISAVQMIFSSIFGSYLNNKRGTIDVIMVSIIGFGGLLGASLSGIITANLSDKILEIIFLIFMFFAIFKMFFKTKQNVVQKDVNKIILFVLGLVLGAFSMTIGVGGGLLLVPILVGLMHVEIKKAISAGLFFVVFSSISGVISHSLNQNIDFNSGIIIGLASLVGVYVGIIFKDKIESKLQKKLLLGLYLVIITYLINRIFING
ncbi:MAG: sulfite exporter TauE/SafE family protein [Sulfurimonas sp.]|nr:sulfite exporter TauE/SafE family protein [Sulfurimonas sp.]